MCSVVIKHKSINNGEGIILFKNNWFSDNSHAEYYDNGYKYWLYYQQYSSETKKVKHKANLKILRLAKKITNTPVVAIFSSRDCSVKWYPPNKSSKVFKAESISCSHCFSETCIDNICMKSIKPEHIINYLKEVGF